MKDSTPTFAISTIPFEEIRAQANLLQVDIGIPGMVKDDDRYNANSLTLGDGTFDPMHRDALCLVYGIPQNTTLLELQELPKYKEGLCRIEILKRVVNFTVAGGFDKFRAIVHIARQMNLLTAEYDAEVKKLFKDLDGA